jgi:hypothetical protein
MAVEMDGRGATNRRSEPPAAGRAAADTRCCDVVSCDLSLQYDIGWELRLRENRAEFFPARADHGALGKL